MSFYRSACTLYLRQIWTDFDCSLSLGLSKDLIFYAYCCHISTGFREAEIVSYLLLYKLAQLLPCDNKHFQLDRIEKFDYTPYLKNTARGARLYLLNEGTAKF